MMPPGDPSALQIVLDEVRLVRADVAGLRADLAGYSAARCESHAERMHRVESRLDTERAAREALSAQSSLTWKRMAASLAMMAAVAALVTLGMRIFGL
jgi:hypothetical protein